MQLEKGAAAISVVGLPLTGILALGAFTNVAMIFSIVFLFFFMLRNRVRIDRKIVLVIAVVNLYILTALFISVILGRAELGEWAIKYIRMHLFVSIYSLAFFLVIKTYGIEFVLKCIYYSVLISMLYGLFDFFLSNFLHFKLDDYLHRARVQESSSRIAELYRIRSFTDESGHYALFLCSMVPLAILYLKFKAKKVFWFMTVSLFTGFLTFSAALFVILPVTLIIVAVLNVRKLVKRKRNIVALIVVVCAVIMGSIYVRQTVYYDLTLSKLSFSESSISASERMENYNAAWGYIKDAITEEDLLELVIGKGIGSIMQERGTTFTNFYLLYIIENGILFLFALVACVFFILKNTFIGKHSYLLQSSAISLLLFILINDASKLLFFWAAVIILGYFTGDVKRSVVSRNKNGEFIHNGLQQG